MALIKPYKDELVNLMAPDEHRDELMQKAKFLPSLSLSPRSLCDLELLAVGGFSPLKQFMGEEDYKGVIEGGRLADNTLWPIPITLPISAEEIINIGQEITLTDEHNTPLAIMHVEEKYKWDLKKEALGIFETLDEKHPLVKEMHHWGQYYIAGKLSVLNLPARPDFKEIRYTPAQLRKVLIELKPENIIAFQTRNPMHRAHEELTKRAMQKINALLLLHPSVGLTKPGDIDYVTRVRIYKTLIENHYPKNKAILSLLPLAMRMAGPREALLHMIIRRNYGANYFIVGRDHAGPGNDSQGKPFYAPDAAQKMAMKYANEIGITPFVSDTLVYVPHKKDYEEVSALSPNETYYNISGTQVREDFLKKGKLLPSWFTRKECATILADAYPPKHQQGLCVLLTGLPCAGKTTIARILATKMADIGKRVTLCDGDVMRRIFAGGLSFSLEDREIYLNRISYLASEVVKHQGIIIISIIYPLSKARKHLKDEVMHKGKGNFVLAYINTPLNVCEERDIKGFYQKAKKGLLENYTGINSPYEIPDDNDIMLSTTAGYTAEQNAEIIFDYLIANNFLLLKHQKK